MNISIISDTHLNHKRIAEYCQRPEGWEELTVSNLIEFKKPLCDILIHLGDVSLGKDEIWHKNLFGALRCKKWLVLGNHDGKSMNWYLSHGWDFVARNFTMYIYGLRIIFSHRPYPFPPMKTVTRELRREIAFSEEMVDIPRSNFDINIHGHCHNREDLVLQKWQKPFILEYQDYKPVDLKEFLSDEIRNKEKDFNEKKPLQNER